MSNELSYPIGRPGTPWDDTEKKQWLAMQKVQRLYADDVLEKLTTLPSCFELSQYGALTQNPKRYPLYAVRSKEWAMHKETVLISGGVHGYETSGVQGALRFLAAHAERYLETLNVVVAPCVSPWGYETINRWNPNALDPNRSFRPNSDCEEAAALMQFLQTLDTQIVIHIDLHETTDTDNSEFRPALSARDAKVQDKWDIPDGFYTVADTLKPEPDFQRAIIQSVQSVTHIAPADENGAIIGGQLQQPGVICYAAASSGLCMGVTDARYVTTTEVYPDSPGVTDEQCIEAQVAAVTGGLDYLLLQRSY